MEKQIKSGKPTTSKRVTSVQVDESEILTSLNVIMDPSGDEIFKLVKGTPDGGYHVIDHKEIVIDKIDLFSFSLNGENQVTFISVNYIKEKLSDEPSSEITFKVEVDLHDKEEWNMKFKHEGKKEQLPLFLFFRFEDILSHVSIDGKLFERVE